MYILVMNVIFSSFLSSFVLSIMIVTSTMFSCDENAIILELCFLYYYCPRGIDLTRRKWFILIAPTETTHWMLAAEMLNHCSVRDKVETSRRIHKGTTPYAASRYDQGHGSDFQGGIRRIQKLKDMLSSKDVRVAHGMTRSIPATANILANFGALCHAQSKRQRILCSLIFRRSVHNALTYPKIDLAHRSALWNTTTIIFENSSRHLLFPRFWNPHSFSWATANYLGWDSPQSRLIGQPSDFGRQAKTQSADSSLTSSNIVHAISALGIGRPRILYNRIKGSKNQSKHLLFVVVSKFEHRHPAWDAKWLHTTTISPRD